MHPVKPILVWASLGFALGVSIILIEWAVAQLPFIRGDCGCLCNFRAAGNPFFRSTGYGKYCGAGYTCDTKTDQTPCNRSDACCMIHDQCVGETGYCHSCECNEALLDCLLKKENVKFGANNKSICSKESKDAMAVSIMIKDLCLLARVDPKACAHCPPSQVKSMSDKCAALGYDMSQKHKLQVGYKTLFGDIICTVARGSVKVLPQLFLVVIVVLSMSQLVTIS